MIMTFGTGILFFNLLPKGVDEGLVGGVLGAEVLESGKDVCHSNKGFNLEIGLIKEIKQKFLPVVNVVFFKKINIL